MIHVSCPTKFWAFAQAEQFHKYGMLGILFTSFATQKHPVLGHFVKRVDKEVIPPAHIKTYLRYAINTRLRRKQNVEQNEEFDNWVAKELQRHPNFSVFIGWAGISLRSIRVTKALGKVSIIERGSSHILFQEKILAEEYSRFGLTFSIDPRVVEKELREYDEVDYIAIPSKFVARSFVEMGIPESKLIINPYGSPVLFKPIPQDHSPRPFRILYMGSVSIRKGIKYLLDAMKVLEFPYEAWFLGNCDETTHNLIASYNNPHIKLWGHIEQSKLPNFISACDVFVMPSIEDGFGMVIPQAISCGIPVITTSNTGGADILENGKTGFVVPIRDPDAIREHLGEMQSNTSLLNAMKNHCRDKRNHVTWDDYGTRYVSHIKNILGEK